MSLATHLAAAILETILTRLAPLFLIGANGDLTTARHAASQILGAYHPQTNDELCLAAQIIGFSFQALEALAQAAQPDLSLTRIIRLRGSAVSLSRESEKAQRRLSQLQKARQQAIAAEIEREPASPEPKCEQPPVQHNKQTQRPEPTPIDTSLKRTEVRSAPLANHASLPEHHSRTQSEAA
ncbi:MAG: hypothetical protein ABSC06_16755 [Rhodopila sp.]|jgi:hypothetical protein